MPGPLFLRPALAFGLALTVLMGSCSADDDDARDAADSVDEAIPDGIVQDRWEAYWEARIASENTARLDTESFAEVARSKALETQRRRIRNYDRHGLVRVGRPAFRDIEVRRSEDSATVLACLDADAWTARVQGEPWTAKKYGWEVTGNVLKQVDGTWFVVDELLSGDVADMGKSC